MARAVIQLETLTCPSCVQKIESAVKSLNGIDKDSVKVLFNSSKVKFDYDPDKISLGEVVKAIATLGYEVIKAQ